MLSNCSMVIIKRQEVELDSTSYFYLLPTRALNKFIASGFSRSFSHFNTLLLLSGCATQSAEKTYRQITMEEAITMMEEETGYIILDVRTAQEYSEKHIPGAINIANESIGTEDISELPDKDQLILVYCRSGNRSKQAPEKLVKLGYTNIVEIGGINSWSGETVTGDK